MSNTKNLTEQEATQWFIERIGKEIVHHNPEYTKGYRECGPIKEVLIKEAHSGWLWRDEDDFVCSIYFFSCPKESYWSDADDIKPKKTIIEHLEEILPPEIFALVPPEGHDAWCNFSNSPSDGYGEDDFCMLFEWTPTDEGLSFWHQVACAIKGECDWPEIPPIKDSLTTEPKEEGRLPRIEKFDKHNLVISTWDVIHKIEELIEAENKRRGYES